MIELTRLEAVLAALGNKTVGLVGDLFLDRYLEIDADLHELSVETGLEAYQISRIRNQPGAMGTVMNNLADLGVGRMVPVSVVGDDGQAYDLLAQLGAMPVDTSHVMRERGRNTPTYTKPLKPRADGSWVELNRFDLRNRVTLTPRVERELADRITSVFAATEGLIVADQVNEEGWGVITPAIRAHLIALAEQAPEKLIFVDSRAHIGRFTRGTLKPNLAECLQAMGKPASDDPAAARQAAQQLAERNGTALFCTMGPRGMLVVRPKQAPVEVPGYPARGPVDVVGAGDSATAGIVTALLFGASDAEAATLGNLVASITVEQIGTTGTARPADVIARWHQIHG